MTEPLGVEAQHFVDSIRNGAQPLTDGRDGERIVRVLEEVDLQLRATVRMDSATPAAPASEPIFETAASAA